MGFWKSIHPHYWVLLVWGSVVHGLLLLNDGVYWDGWTSVYFPIVDRDWERLHALYTDYGYPIRAYLHWGASYLGSPIFGHKLVTWLSLLLMGFFTYQIFTKINQLTRTENLLLAMWVISYPAYRVTVELIMMPYTLAYAAYLGAVWGLLVTHQLSGWRFWAVRGAVLATFYFSFWIYSLLVFHYGVLLWLAVRELRRESWRQDLRGFILRHLDVGVLPLLFWVILQQVFQPSDYYAVDASSSPLISLLNFLQYGIYGQFAAALDLFFAFSPLIILIGGLGWWLYQFLPSEPAQMDVPWVWVGVGLVWLASAIFPYIAAGFYPTLDGWWTRHNLLLALPLGFTLIWLNRWCSPNYRVGLVGLALLVMLFSLIQVDQYMNWQGRWVKDRAIISQLAAQSQYQDSTIFWIDDQFPLGYENRYRPLEWGAFFRQAWGGESRLGLGLADYPLTALLITSQDPVVLQQSYLSDWRTDGCQTLLRVRQGNRPQTYRDEWGLSVRYWAYKFLMPHKLDEFLSGITQLEFIRVIAPQATQCTRQQELDLTWLDPDMAWRTHLVYLNTAHQLSQTAQHNSQNADELRLWQAMSGVESLTDAESTTLEAAGFDPWWYATYRHLIETSEGF